MAAAVCERRFIDKKHVQKSRFHDYLYDPAFVVSGARDFARMAFRSAMESAQVKVLPIFETMFSDLKNCPRTQIALHPNARLPDHVLRCFTDIEHNKMADNTPAPAPPASQITGADRYKYFSVPKPVLVLPKVEPILESLPPSPNQCSISRGVQTKYRESSAQTRPWQPKAVVNEDCKEMPEVLYLDKLIWGPGYYRTGDLPADFHTTEIINKMRHKRSWMARLAAADKDGTIDLQSREYIVRQVETHDWLFREAEIDEIQRLRMGLMHNILAEHRSDRVTRIEGKLQRLWSVRRDVMRDKLHKIHKHKERELRKLRVARDALKSDFDKCGVLKSLLDPAASEYAPLTREGERTRRGHECIQLRVTEGFVPCFKEALEMPTNLIELTESTRAPLHAPRQRQPQICPRQYRTTDQDLLHLQESLRRTRADNSHSAPPRCLVVRAPAPPPRPATPTQEGVTDEHEAHHQAALLLQRAIRGRAVQTLMYEGRNRDRELIEHLKSKDKNPTQECVHDGEQTDSLSLEAKQCAAVSHGLHFLETELRRLKGERKEHAAILIALRKRTMIEADEAGRRQKEERRRREHDQVFRQVLGLTRVSIDAYLEEAITDGIQDATETMAVEHATDKADEVELQERGEGISCRLIDQLVHTSDKTEVTREVEQERIKKGQSERVKHAWDVIFAGHRNKTAQQILDTIINEAAEAPPCTCGNDEEVDNQEMSRDSQEICQESQDWLRPCPHKKKHAVESTNEEQPIGEPESLEEAPEVKESEEEICCTSDTCLDQVHSDLQQYVNRCKCDEASLDCCTGTMRTDERNHYRQPDSPYDVRESERDSISKNWPT